MASRGQQKRARQQAERAAIHEQAEEIAKSNNTDTGFRFYNEKPQAPDTAAKTKVIHEENIEEPTLAENPSLFEENKKRNFRYPLSMPASGKGYPGTITFEAHNVKGVDIGKSMKDIYDRLIRKKEVVEDASTEDEKKKADDAKEKNGRNQAELDKSISKLGKTASQSYENVNAGESVGRVILPLQRDLRFSDNVVYESPPIGMLGAGLEGAIGGKNPFEGATNGDGTFSTAASALAAQAVAKASGAGVGALVGKIAGGALGGAVLGSGATESLGDAVKSATRIASAPNQRTLFKEVQIRQFAFTFKLIANSKREAEEIKSIIKFFRQELYPEMMTVGDNKVPIAYKFPNVFSINVKNQFGGNAASKIQRCYLRDVQTSYNATGNGLLEDGSFIEVDISLSFQEVKALDKQMVALEDY